MTHELKTHTEPFIATWENKKLFEVREFDRPFKVGDKVILREFHPKNRTYSGMSIEGEITYIAGPGKWGMPKNVGVLGIAVTNLVSSENRFSLTPVRERVR